MNAITLENISVSLRRHFWQPKRTILTNLSLTVISGQIYGFLGANGAGKTTAMKVMLGLLKQDEGQTLLWGQPSHDSVARKSVGFLPEQPYFSHHLTGFEVVTQHALLAGSTFSDAKKDAVCNLEKMGIGHAKHHRLSTYSKGMLQRLGLAQACVAKPRLLILDEPMSGLDPIGRRDVRELMFEMKKQGTTIFFSTHNLSDAEQLCDHVGILVRGQLTKSGPLSALTTTIEEPVEVIADIAHEKIASIIEGLTVECILCDSSVIFRMKGRKLANELMRRIYQQQGMVISMQVYRGLLENIFVEETLGGS